MATRPQVARGTRETNRASRIAAVLLRSMPKADTELGYRSPWELLVATILSAQCTDQRVNQVTPALFNRYRQPREFAQASVTELEAFIRSTGFYKSKAKHLIGCARAVEERFHGRVPSTMDELTSLPGVGRKTANVLLGNAFNQPAVIVDTHVKRVTNRLGFTRSENPDQIETDLRSALAPAQWTPVSQRLLLHGRYVCQARKPRCAMCVLYDECPWKGKLPR